jgi:hypothetical protein
METVKVTDYVTNKIILHITHQTQCELSAENTGILCLVFFQNIRLHRTTHLGKVSAFIFSYTSFGST